MTRPLDKRSPEYIAWFNEHVHEREPNDDPPVWWTPDAAVDLDGRDSPVGRRRAPDGD